MVKNWAKKQCAKTTFFDTLVLIQISRNLIPEGIDELADCAAFLEEKHGSLEYFRTTDAAYDVDRLIQATRKDDDEVYIYGFSYGTFWLNRFLKITSQRMDGLIFDGGVGPESACNSTADIIGIDAVGRELLQRCAQDTNCSSYLPDTEETLARLYQKLDAGHCPELGINGKVFDSLVYQMLDDVELRDYIPSLIHRINRCEQRDIEAFTNLEDFISKEAAENIAFLQHQSEFAQKHIIFNDLWDETELKFEEREELKETLFHLFDQYELDDYWDAWPSIYQDEFADRIASTDVPVLFLQGTLDPRIPNETADSFGQSFDGPYQNYVHVYDAAHGVLWQSPLADYAEFSCGMDLVGQFLSDPKADLDTSCTYGVKPLNFNGEPLTTKALYGTDDVWN